MPRSDAAAGSIGKRSLSRKYSTGYFLMLLVVVIIFSVSVFCEEYISDKYQGLLEELLELNELFVDVENANRSLYEYYTYLRPSSNQQYLSKRAVAMDAVERMMARLNEDYSREVMDLCCMVQTYLMQGVRLLQQLDAYGAIGSTAGNAVLQNAYNGTQRTISYINQSFKEIYSQKLISAQELQLSIQSMRRQLNVFQLAMLAVGIIICAWYYKRVVNGITRSVRKLTAFAENAAQSPIGQEHVVISTGDELSVFADAFNEMLDTIQRQIVQIEEDSRVRAQLQEVEMENLRITSALQSSRLAALQSRINPHFLFNTLNMISQTARVENAERTAHLMEATSDMLRYNLGKVSKAVTLGDELENTRNYVYIQQCRFGKRIAFGFEADDSCARLEAPCMIVQPLVENSIAHGVGAMISGGRVDVRLFREGGRVCLEVEDNGAGISPQKLKALVESFSDGESAGEHIGVKNVYLRLMLFFNGDLGFDISSAPGRTLVRVSMPER